MTPTDGSLAEDDGLVLRPATPADGDPVADLYAAARAAAVPLMPPAVHSNAEDRAFYGPRVSGELGHDCWVAESGAGLVGFVLFTSTWLDGLYVAPGAQGRGVGSALLELVKAQRPEGFCLWVFESNAPARALYARHGLLELEHTDGSANEERAPDLRMAWPGHDPLGFLRGLVDEVDTELGDLLARRAALTAAVQTVKPTTERDPAREEEIAAAVASRVPGLGRDRVARIMQAVITESLAAAERPDLD